MYQDSSLQPQETIRMLALGLLAEGPRPYDDLAREIRRFTARVIGPSLDLLGSSLEILRLEGLAAQAGSDKKLTITDNGKAALTKLLQANLRMPLDDVNRLALLIKLRFIGQLSDGQRQQQYEMISEVVQKQRAWAKDLAKDYPNTALADWLALDSAEAETRLNWLKDK